VEDPRGQHRAEPVPGRQSRGEVSAMSRVVVGIDGSEQAGRALRLAVEEARLRGAELAVVHVVPLPFDLTEPVLMPQPTKDELRAMGRAVIDEALGGVGVDDLEVERIVLIGHAAHRLCSAARGADLLVVGSRGLGGFRGLLVGSVTHQVVGHAPCPILVVVPEQ
jgi:nucleotide-binding universal stress UspA family protein